MSVLASLAHAYDRMAERHEVPPFGYSTEKIGFVISLNADGTVAGLPSDLRESNGKKRVARPMAVPQPPKRTSGIAPNFLWDKTSYVLGIGEGKRLADEHAAFVARHEDWLSKSEDAGLKALLLFLRAWRAEAFDSWRWPEDMKDQNAVFALESERLQNIYIHDRPAARTLWAHHSSSDEKAKSVCLVSGDQASIARLHPAIKGVWGAQSSGASLVSFNLDAFESYGHEQGENAPVSEAAAFAYTTVLNKFLESGSKNRIQIGDASTVFWADAGDAEIAEEVEGIFAAMLGAEIDEAMQAGKVGAILEKIRNGQPLKDFAPNLAEGVRFCVLGLAPNAARLSVRFWLESDFGTVAKNYQRFLDDMRIAPPPRDIHVPLWRYLIETAVLRKRENIPPNLTGEWMRSILTGTSYPLTLLSSTLIRLRSDKDAKPYSDHFALRASIIKAVLKGNRFWEAPVELDRTKKDPLKDAAYLLGRLFAILERFQQLALGENINATIRDRYYGAASATPGMVFPLLLRLNMHHQNKAESNNGALTGYYLKQLREVMSALPPAFPNALALVDQGKFALGYYQQFNVRSDSKASKANGETTE